MENFELKKLNVLIGGNGAGKSNFIDFFRLLRSMMDLSLPGLQNVNLQSFIKDGGGIHDFLFNGPKVTKEIHIQLLLNEFGYQFKLSPTADENVIIYDEKTYHRNIDESWKYIGGGYDTSKLLKDKDDNSLIANHIYDSIQSCHIYHFNDSSKNASMRHFEVIEDYDYLRFDAANIAPFLLRIREKNSSFYNDIIETIRLVIPFFDDFILKESKNDKVKLNWKQKGSDYPMRPHLFSDGSMRFICLATALLQPDPPSTMIIDEPELGMHPYAIEILAELIDAASQKSQLIISTQSSNLVDYFEPENIIVVFRDNGSTQLNRLHTAELIHWLDEYTLGDLWRKNIISGVPVYE
ncbi:MAG: SMC domain-containing protein [Candidatus Magnetoglobus multicellularis str. Araruama]|uniref:SMC domain-containing protein n=1 Tax=Candidatus Magnetoglobus multicellularis str. Araruama TaxID=890399 RepID=A0A1V1P933_9BACT|nr:MAG: SMC domain-containing protein [Candidatus Magnetoglobus multicellularis str. Araruama]